MFVVDLQCGPVFRLIPSEDLTSHRSQLLAVYDPLLSPYNTPFSLNRIIVMIFLFFAKIEIHILKKFLSLRW